MRGKRAKKNTAKVFWEFYGSQDVPSEDVTYLSIDPGYVDLPVYYGRRTSQCLTTYDLRLFSFKKSPRLFERLTRILSEHFARCYAHRPFDIVLIEKQLDVSRLPKMVSHVLFAILTKDYPHVSVYFLSSRIKTANRRLYESKDPKLCSIERSIRWCKIFHDHRSLKRIRSATKGRKDDYADVITQAQAFFEILGRFADPEYYQHQYFDGFGYEYRDRDD